MPEPGFLRAVEVLTDALLTPQEFARHKPSPDQMTLRWVTIHPHGEGEESRRIQINTETGEIEKGFGAGKTMHEAFAPKSGTLAASETTAAPSRKWYGMTYRPPALGAIPKGEYEHKPHPDFRHGQISYNEPLSQEMQDAYELTPIHEDGDIPAVAKSVGAAMGKYAGEYAKPQNAQLLDNQLSLERIRKLLGHVDKEKLKAEFRKQFGQESDADRIESEASSIADGVQKQKQRSMIYQADDKERLAEKHGKPLDAYHDLPFDDWMKLRAADDESGREPQKPDDAILSKYPSLAEPPKQAAEEEVSPEAPANPVVDTESLREHQQMYRDNIATLKAQGKPIPQKWLDGLADVTDKLEGKTTEQGLIASNEVFGHPSATTDPKYQNLIPIRVGDVESIERKRSQAQSLLDELQTKIGKATAVSGGKVSATAKQKKEAAAYLGSMSGYEDRNNIDALRNETLPELARLQREIENPSTRASGGGGQAATYANFGGNKPEAPSLPPEIAAKYPSLAETPKASEPASQESPDSRFASAIHDGRVDDAMAVLSKLPHKQAEKIAGDLGMPVYNSKTKKGLLETVRKIAENNTPEKREARSKREFIQSANADAKRALDNADAHALGRMGAPLDQGLSDEQVRDPHSDDHRHAVQAAWSKKVADAFSKLDKSDPTAQALIARAKHLGIYDADKKSPEAAIAEKYPSLAEPKPAEQSPSSQDAAKEPWQMRRDDFVDSELDKAANDPSHPEYPAMKSMSSAGKFRQWQDSLRKNLTAKWYDSRENAASEGKPVSEKPAWMLTKAEEERQYGNGESEHRQDITNALAAGKPVPAEVLAEYPDLKPKAAFKPEGVPGEQMGLFDQDAGGQKSLFNIVKPDKKSKKASAAAPSELEKIGDEHKARSEESAPLPGQKSIEDEPTIAGMTLDEAADLASRHHPEDRQSLRDKIQKRPSAWVQALQGYQAAEKTQRSSDAKESRDSKWKPNEGQQKVLDLIQKHGGKFDRDRDYPMKNLPGFEHKAANTQALLKRGLLERHEMGDKIHYTVNQPKPAQKSIRGLATKPKNTAEADEKIASQKMASDFLQESRDEKEQAKRKERVSQWRSGFTGSPKENNASGDIARHDWEKALQNGVSPKRLSEMVDSAVQAGALDAGVGKHLKSRFSIEDQYPSLKGFVPPTINSELDAMSAEQEAERLRRSGDSEKADAIMDAVRSYDTRNPQAPQDKEKEDALRAREKERKSLERAEKKANGKGAWLPPPIKAELQLRNQKRREKFEAAELLAKARKYTEYGENYSRNIAASANRLQSLIDRGHSPAAIKHAADELALRLNVHGEKAGDSKEFSRRAPHEELIHHLHEAMNHDGKCCYEKEEGEDDIADHVPADHRHMDKSVHELCRHLGASHPELQAAYENYTAAME